MELQKIQKMLREKKSKKSRFKQIQLPSETNDKKLRYKDSTKPKAPKNISEYSSEILNKIKLQHPYLYSTMNQLNEFQQMAVFSEDKRSLVSAMVGSGKTTILICKILYLHFIKNVPLEKMAVLTFTNKAANEIKERLLTLYMQDNQINISNFYYFGTFHSVARNILINSDNLKNLGYTSDFTIMDENERIEFYLRLINEMNLNIKYKNKIDKRIEKYLFKNQIKTHSKTLYGNMKQDDDLEYLLRIGEKRKTENNVMDFDDLINNAILVLCEPDNNMDFQWIIVDEFQDCNRSQIDMINLMSRDYTSIFVVGDPNQLIYGWRGSDLQIFHSFKTSDCHEYYLPLNYRSTSNILNVAKHLITYDTKELYGIREDGVPVTIVNHYDSNQEAIYLANTIKFLHKKEIPYREIAILFRTKRQAEILKTVFETKDIPFEVIIRQTLKDFPALNWFLKVLRASLNKDDLNAILDSIFDEKYGNKISINEIIKKYKLKGPQLDRKSELEKFIDWISIHSNIQNQKESKNFAKKMLEFETWINNRTYNDISKIFDFFDLEINLKPASSSYPDDVNIIKKFLDTTAQYLKLNNNTQDIKASLLSAINQSFLDGYQIFGEYIDPNSEKVKLLTIHSSKGLEFRYVFVSGANNGLIPLNLFSVGPDRLEEEKRLFFVAMTRAKDYLEISYHTVPEGWNSYPEPSIYLNEIPKNLLEFKDVKEVKKQTLNVDNKSYEKSDQWYVGQCIKHPKYGTGIISKITKGNIICNFDNLGEKSFSENFLPILPIYET